MRIFKYLIVASNWLIMCAGLIALFSINCLEFNPFNFWNNQLFFVIAVSFMGMVAGVFINTNPNDGKACLPLYNCHQYSIKQLK